jgi:hypothetical protein
MDNFNKVLSFILGLVVVIVFFAVLTGRINLKKNFPLLNAKTSPTPQAKITPTPVSAVTVSNSNAYSTQSTTSYNRYQTTNKTPSTIPSTGSPTFFLPFFFSTLGAGIYLKKKA